MSTIERIAWKRGRPPGALLSREWLVANSLGGYASGTAGNVTTRRFHGLLVAALPAPHGRLMALNDLTEEACIGDACFDVGTDETLEEFRLELGLPVWTSEHRGVRVQKRLVMPHRQNTTYVTYRVLDAPGPVTLRLRPWYHIRPHEGVLAQTSPDGYPVRVLGDRWEVDAGNEISVRTTVLDAPCHSHLDGGRVRRVGFRVEQDRGYDWEEDLWSPGWHEVVLEPGSEATFVASVEPWDRIDALTPKEAHGSERERRGRLLAQAAPPVREGIGAELVLAADQFVITPQRLGDTTRARAVGYEASTVIAGYHWFTDWGRDTMIGLEGLTLATGRATEAASILRTFAHHVQDGLVPNMFPEGENDGLYHTADATLWFFHAVHRYVLHTRDEELLAHLLPTLEEIIRQHRAGTRFGIGVDPGDHLLSQGAEGYQLTWMDAKVGDWVVTPRRGKAVEINALYYNALCLLRDWLIAAGEAERAAPLAQHAEDVYKSFNARFWFETPDGGRLYDVIDGPAGHDEACRPNQILSISLDHPILDPARWQSVVREVESKLLTPVGLRSLSATHPDYKARYDGDLRSRDAAYHQGTVWGWLIGPFIDAYRKTHVEDADATQRLLSGLIAHLGEAGVGSISEIFDAEPPYLPRGCIAQAWSVAETLRILSTHAR